MGGSSSRVSNSPISQDQAEAHTIAQSPTPTLDGSNWSDGDSMEDREAFEGPEESGEGESEWSSQNANLEQRSSQGETAGGGKKPKSRKRRAPNRHEVACPREGCKKLFGGEQALFHHLEHADKHNVGRPFPCSQPDCTRSFSERRRLKSHLDDAHGIRGSHKCDLCHQAFAAASGLVSHKSSKHQIKPNVAKPHGCDICARKFAKERDLKFHLERHKESARRPPDEQTQREKGRKARRRERQEIKARKGEARRQARDKFEHTEPFYLFSRTVLV